MLMHIAGQFLFVLFLFAFCRDKEVYGVEKGYVNYKQQHNGQGIENGITVHKIIDNVVGCAVTPHKEHIVVINQNVCKICRTAEGKENREGDGHILPFHTCHTRDEDVEGGKTRDGVGDTRYHIVKRKHRVTGVVLTCGIGAEDRTQQSEYRYKVKGCLFDSAFRESGKGQGDELNTAQKKGQLINPFHRIVIDDAHHNNFENFEAVNEECRPDDDTILLFVISVSVSDSQ